MPATEDFQRALSAFYQRELRPGWYVGRVVEDAPMYPYGARVAYDRVSREYHVVDAPWSRDSDRRTAQPLRVELCRAQGRALGDSIDEMPRNHWLDQGNSRRTNAAFFAGRSPRPEVDVANELAREVAVDLFSVAADLMQRRGTDATPIERADILATDVSIELNLRRWSVAQRHEPSQELVQMLSACDRFLRNEQDVDALRACAPLRVARAVLLGTALLHVSPGRDARTTPVFSEATRPFARLQVMLRTPNGMPELSRNGVIATTASMPSSSSTTGPLEGLKTAETQVSRFRELLLRARVSQIELIVGPVSSRAYLDKERSFMCYACARNPPSGTATIIKFTPNRCEDDDDDDFHRPIEFDLCQACANTIKAWSFLWNLFDDRRAAIAAVARGEQAAVQPVATWASDVQRSLMIVMTRFEDCNVAGSMGDTLMQLQATKCNIFEQQHAVRLLRGEPRRYMSRPEDYLDTCVDGRYFKAPREPPSAHTQQQASTLRSPMRGFLPPYEVMRAEIRPFMRDIVRCTDARWSTGLDTEASPVSIVITPEVDIEAGVDTTFTPVYCLDPGAPVAEGARAIENRLIYTSVASARRDARERGTLQDIDAVGDDEFIDTRPRKQQQQRQRAVGRKRRRRHDAYDGNERPLKRLCRDPYFCAVAPHVVAAFASVISTHRPAPQELISRCNQFIASCTRRPLRLHC